MRWQGPANDDDAEGTPLAGMLDRINRVKISAELLGAVLHSQIGVLPKDRSPEEARMLRLFQVLMNEGFRAGELGMMATAIEFRLTALANLIADDDLLGWSVPRHAKSPALITLEMLQAAAKEPLIEDGEGQAAFDIESFRSSLLARACIGGQA